MAKSGSFETSKFKGDYGDRYVKFSWELVSQDIAKNQSKIKWTLKGAGGQDGYYYKAHFKVVINDSTVYSTTADERIELYNNTTVASGNLTITHATDGTKKFTASVDAAIYSKSMNCDGEGSWQLDAIPRYGTVSHSLKSATETTAVMNWSSDSVVDYLWYSKDNGASWTGVDVADGKSGTYTITGLAVNTTHKIKTKIQRKDSQLPTVSSALSVTTYNYPHCTVAPDFVIGNAVALQFYNPLNRSFGVTITGNGSTIKTWTGQSGTTYTGANDAEAVTALYNSIKSATSTQYTVTVTYGSSSIATNSGHYSVDAAKCAPTFDTFTYRDANASVTGITGNNKVFVKGLSQLEVSIAAANKMVANNYATPSRYTFGIGTISVSEPYSTSDIAKAVGVVAAAGTKRLTVTAYDSRGLSTAKYQDVTVVDYAKPTLSVTLKRLNGFEAQTTLTINGQFAPVKVGGVAKNGVQSLKYRYKESGGTWPTSYTTVDATVSGEKFSYTIDTLSLNNTKAFDFEVVATDKFGTATATAKVDVGVPVFMISSNKKKCYINGEEVATLNSVQTVGDTVPTMAEIVDKVYPVGSVFITNTNTSPATTLGRGSWALIDKGFLAVNTNAAGTSYFTPATGVTNNGTYITRAGHSLTVKQDLIINQAMSDTGMTLGNFKWSAIGITSLPQSVNDGATFSDGANGGFSYSISADTGELKQLDVVGIDTIATGKSYHVSFTMAIDWNYMANVACDKFYWKRTS